MKNILVFTFLLFVLTVNVIPSFADDDDDEREDAFEFGENEREDEDEREDDDDERIGLGTEFSDMVLYGTIAAIVGSIGYTGFRIMTMKRPKIKSK